ncbi:MAG: hypothetical protein WCK01_01360 [Candidatus Uhrbacteria bacterium]
MNNKLIISCIIVAVLFGAGGFYGGMQYTNANRVSARAGGPTGQGFARGQGAPGMNGQGRGGFGGGAAGEVLSKTDKSLTLKLMDGGSKIVYLSGSTTVNKMATGSLDDVSAGTNVTIVGSSNSDGSVTASMIQLRPARPVDATSTR